MRASSSFVLNIVFGLIGVGLGPTLIGIVSDRLAQRAFGSGHFAALCPGGIGLPGTDAGIDAACRSAAASGILHAIGGFSLLFAWAGLHFLLAARRLEQDLDRQYEGDARRSA